MGIILRMDHKFIPQEWVLRPASLNWPPQRHAAILWILAHLSTIACRPTTVSHSEVCLNNLFRALVHYL